MTVVKVSKPMYYWQCDYCPHRSTPTYTNSLTAHRDVFQHVKDHHAILNPTFERYEPYGPALDLGDD